MNLILCCGNTGLRERWFSALHSMYSTYQATTLQDLSILVGQKLSFDLLFVHRALVDPEIIAYIRKRQPACKLFISFRPAGRFGRTRFYPPGGNRLRQQLHQPGTAARGGTGRGIGLGLDQPATDATTDSPIGDTTSGRK